MLARTLATCAIFLFAVSAKAQDYWYFSFNQPAGCQSRVPVSNITQVPKGYLVWTGSCVNGFAEGRGEILTYRNGVLLARTIGSQHVGLQEGPTVLVDTDPNGGGYGEQDYFTALHGFPDGHMTHLDKTGLVLAEADTDGKGGFEQTSNPMSPIIAMIGRALQGNKYVNGAKLFIEMFAPEAGTSAVGCMGIMKVLRYTDQAAGYWCNVLPGTTW